MNVNGAVEKRGGGDIEFECKQLKGGGQNFNVQLQRGVKSGCTGLDGGGQKRVVRNYQGGPVLSASDFRNSTAPPAVNNDHSHIDDN